MSAVYCHDVIFKLKPRPKTNLKYTQNVSDFYRRRSRHDVEKDAHLKNSSLNFVSQFWHIWKLEIFPQNSNFNIWTFFFFFTILKILRKAEEKIWENRFWENHWKKCKENIRRRRKKKNLRKISETFWEKHEKAEL